MKARRKPDNIFLPGSGRKLAPQGRRVSEDSEASAGVWLASGHRLRGQLCHAVAFWPRAPRQQSP